MFLNLAHHGYTLQYIETSLLLQLYIISKETHIVALYLEGK